MKDDTAFSNWKCFHIQLKLLELLWINGILSRSGERKPSGVFFYSPTLDHGNVPADLTFEDYSLALDWKPCHKWLKFLSILKSESSPSISVSHFPFSFLS